jgi:hypothetical protein
LGVHACERAPVRELTVGSRPCCSGIIMDGGIHSGKISGEERVIKMMACEQANIKSGSRSRGVLAPMANLEDGPIILKDSALRTPEKFLSFDCAATGIK